MSKTIHLNYTVASPMFNRLTEEIRGAKQGRASAKQWLATIKALSQKGVKAAEISDIKLDEWLAVRGEDVIQKPELLAHIERVTPTIKEIVGVKPKYAGWVQPGGMYEEIYYCLASERDRMSDRLEEVEHEMSLLSLDAAGADPFSDVDEMLRSITNLENERAFLMRGIVTAYDFTAHHWSTDLSLKNMVAHARVSKFPDGTYFINEIQSDWAQRGRRYGWGENYPEGPLVTSTEAWAGMVIRRQMQRAAQDPACKRLAWITETMRNGGEQNVDKEQRDAQMVKEYTAFVKERTAQYLDGRTLPDDAIARLALEDEARLAGERAAQQQGLHMPGDLLNDFYLRVVPKLADKAVSGTGESIKLTQIQLGNRMVTVPSLEITDAVRAKLTAKQPVYSFAQTRPRPADESDQQFQQALRNAHVMLGDLAQVRLLKKVYDIATGAEVAGRTVDRLLQVSLAARDPKEVMDHECMHFALEHLLDSRERKVLEEAFAIGSPLHRRVCEIALLDNEPRLARQCQSSVEEAIAQGFAYWAGDRDLHLEDSPPAQGIFARLADAIRTISQWVRKAVMLEELHTVDEIFAHLANGMLADRETEHQAAMEAMRPGVGQAA